MLNLYVILYYKTSCILNYILLYKHCRRESIQLRCRAHLATVLWLLGGVRLSVLNSFNIV